MHAHTCIHAHKYSHAHTCTDHVQRADYSPISTEKLGLTASVLSYQQLLHSQLLPLFLGCSDNYVAMNVPESGYLSSISLS